MNYLSKNTERIIENIDDINEYIHPLDYDYFNISNIKPLYNTIFKLYKKINYNIISKNIEYINTTNFCGTFDLLDYLLNNNFLDNFKNININDNGNQISLDTIIKERLKDKYKIWINLHGKLLLRNLYLLKETKKIPKEFFNNFSIIDEDLLSEFTPFDIIEFLGNNRLIKYTFSLNYLDTNVTLKIISKTKLNYNLIDKIIKKIYLMVSLKKQNEPKIEAFTIVLILTNFCKKISSEYNVLGPREINSGVCIFSSRKIVIFRKEEFEKLIIHELAHLLNLDFHQVSISNITQYVNINPNTEFRINESITEILALIINSILVCIDLSNKKNYKLAAAFLNYEINFNLVQVSKILSHFGFKNSKDFFTNYNNDNRFNQTTSVLSYFIIKTCVLFNKDYFHNFFRKNYTNFNYNNKQQANDNYINLVIESLQNKEFHDKINNLLQKNNYKNKNKFLKNTLRMTCIECYS